VRIDTTKNFNFLLLVDQIAALKLLDYRGLYWQRDSSVFVKCGELLQAQEQLVLDVLASHDAGAKSQAELAAEALAAALAQDAADIDALDWSTIDTLPEAKAVIKKLARLARRKAL